MTTRREGRQRAVAGRPIEVTPLRCSGLGLSIVQAIVEAHGGTVVVNDDGTRSTVQLPKGIDEGGASPTRVDQLWPIRLYEADGI